jgi:hypothetical protein
MSTNLHEHQAWQDGHHLGQHARLTLVQRVRAHAVVPDRLPRLWQHPPLGYLVAVLAQLAAVSLTLQLRYLCAVWRTVVNLGHQGGNSRERFLGHRTHLEPKGSGESSMCGKRRVR